MMAFFSGDYRYFIQFAMCFSVYCFNLRRRDRHGLRLAVCVPVCLAATVLYTVLIGSQWALPWSKYLCLLFYLAAALAVNVACFDLPPSHFLSLAIGAFALRQMFSAVSRIISLAVRPENPAFALFFREYLVYAVLCVVFYFLVIYPQLEQLKANGVAPSQLIMLSAFMLIAFRLSVSVRDTEPTPGTTEYLLFAVYDFFCSSLILLGQFSFLRRNRVEDENRIMRLLLEKDREQHQMAESTIDSINMKLHDLRHMISSIQEITDDRERGEYIEEIKQTVKSYEGMMGTGSKALDVVLAEKKLLCDRYGVGMSCIVDGQALAFISPPDLYGLFGNALDNAIESVLRESPDLRQISLSVRQNKNMVFVHMENACSRVVTFDRNGLVVEEDSGTAHGYGLKSMKYITEKYGGTMRLGWKDGVFTLDLAFVPPDNRE